MSLGSGEVFAIDMVVDNSTSGGISGGINNISEKGALVLADGNYKGFENSNIIINKNVTIQGSSKSGTVIYTDSKNAFIVEKGNTLTLINLTIISNYFYNGNDIANYGSKVHTTNGSVGGEGNVIFNNCNFVNDNNNVNVNVNALSSYTTSSVVFTAHVTDLSGKIIYNGDVAFFINNAFSGRVPVINGMAVYSLNLPNGNYLVHAAYVDGYYDRVSQNQVSFNVNAPMLISPTSSPIPSTNASLYWYVDPVNGNDDWDGRSVATAKKTILNAFNNAAAGSIIILLPGTYSGAGNVGITLSNKNMTIWGNNTAGDVIIQPTATFLTISAGTSASNLRKLNLYNMIIAEGTGNKIIIEGNNNFTIDSLQFVNASGSGIYSGTGATNSDIFVYIYNTTFSNLTGTSGSAINLQSYGGVLFINGSNFINVWGSSIGGVIRCYYGKPVIINHTNFTNSGVTSSSHGGIFCLSNYNAAYPSSLVIDNSRFTNISSQGQGGVTYTHSGQTNISNTIFENCWGSDGGVIYNQGTDPIRLNNVTFDGCYATGSGGAIYTASSGSIFVDNSTFKNNYANGANGAGGAIWAGSGTINITNTIFENNSARTQGGAINAGGATIHIINVNFTNNSAVTYGGAIGSSGSGNIRIFDSTFAGNRVTGSTGYGGALGASGGTINFTNSRFNDNSASTYGGALGVSGTSNVNVLNSNLTGNTAVTYGGAVGIAGGNFYGYMSNFDYNHAGTFGGAVGAVAGLNISNCNFTHNTASGNGGAIGSNSAAGTNNYVFSNNFMYNSAGTDGNAIWATQRLTLNYNRLVSNFNQGSTSPYNTVWTNTSATGVNVDYNWWGNNEQYATGVQPNNFIVVDVDLNNVGLWNWAAHYIYTINTNVTKAGGVDLSFDPSLLPTFFGEAYIVMVHPNNYTRIFDAHINGTEIIVPYNTLTYQIGYFQVDNWRIPINNSTNFNISTVSTPNITLSNTTGRYNDTVTLNATFRDNGGYGIAGLNVSFYINGTFLGWNITNADGVAYYEYKVPSAGTYNYTVIYKYENSLSFNSLYVNYASTMEEIWINFNKLSTSIVNVTNVTGRSGLPVGFNATIIDENGNYVGNVILYFSLANGTIIYSGSSNSVGYVGGSHTFPVQGNYSYYIYFDGNGNYSATNSSAYIALRAEILPVVNLTITKNVSTTNVVNGQQIFYTITVTNNGPDVGTNVTVTDLIDSRLVYLNTNNTANVNYAGNLLTWNVGTLNVGQSVSLIINVRVNNTGSINNVANVTVNEPNIGNSTTEGDSNANITVLPTVNLTILKTVNLPTGVIFGSNIVYTIIVTNNGPNNATNIRVTDVLNSKLIYVSNNDTARASISSNIVTWVVPSLNVGQSVSLNITVRVNGTGSIANVAAVTVTENNIGMDNSDQNVNSNATITPPPTVNLTVTKTVSTPSGVTVGSNVVYTITVRNNGPDAGTNVIVTDVLDVKLEYVDNDGSATNVDNTVTWIIPNIAVGQSFSLIITARVVGTGNITNVANVTDVDQPNVGMNNTGNTTFNSANAVNLTITKTMYLSDGSDTGYGSQVVYTIVVFNNGPDTANNLNVWDVLDSRLDLLSASPSQGQYNPLNGRWTVGSLANGTGATLIITVRIVGTGTIGNIANLTVNEYNIGNNTTERVIVTIAPTVNLTTTKTVTLPPGGVTVGSKIVYTITVTNNGPDRGTDVVVSDVLDPRLNFIVSSATKGSYNLSTGIWNIGNLNVGETVRLNITVEIRGTGTINNIATVNVTQINVGMNSTGDRFRDAQIILPPTVNLTITKTATPMKTYYGYDVRFAIIVTNNGPDAGTNVTITNRLDSRFTFVNQSADIGNYNPSTGVWFIGDMDVGDSYSLLINVRVMGTGNITNVARVTVDQPNVGMNNRSVTVEVPKIVTNSSIGATGEFKVDKPMTISGVTRDQFGNRFANIGLKVAIDGKTYSVTTKADGSWSFVINEHRFGTFAVVVSWGGNASHAAFTNSTTVVVERYATTVDIYTKNIQEGKDAIITLHLKDHLGNNMVNHKVTKIIAGKTYTGTTNKNGMVTFRLKGLKGKNHAVKGWYDGTSYHGNSAVSKVQVVKPRVDLAITKIKLIKATNKRTNSQIAYYKVTIQNKGSLKSKATKLLSWHIRKGIMVENKYKKIKPLKGGQKKTFLFKYYPDKDYHKYCMSGQYFVLNPKKTMKEIGYKNNKALVLGKAKIKRNFGFSWNPKSYKKNDPKYHKKLNNFARTL